MANELELVKQKQINRQLQLDYEDKCSFIKKLEEKLLHTYSVEEYQDLENKLKELDKKRISSSKFYEEKLLKIQKENEQLKLQKLQNPGDQK